VADGTHGIDALLAALSAYQPGNPVESADVDRLRSLATAGDPWRQSAPLHATASALVVHPPSGRVLLRWHARQRAWLQVGGHADPGESDPLAVAVREAAEETNLADLVPWPDARIVHVAVVPVPAGRHEPAHEHADIRFALATERPDAARPEKPGADLRWLTVPEARAITTADNLRETLNRVERLMIAHARRSA
jgi:8-oxo-dGTP pyrophosphatase MutT (NUDIX family)